VLVVAQRERIPQEIIASSSIPIDIATARLVRRLQEDHSLAKDAAEWAVACWSVALGLTSVPVSVRPHEISSMTKEVTVVPTPPTQPTSIIRDGFIFDADFVTDSRTRLIWARNTNLAGKKMNWDSAMQWVEKVSLGGYYDWRLPNKKELEALVKLGGKRPSAYFTEVGFVNLVTNMGSWYCSSTSNGSNGTWFVDLLDGYVSSIYKSCSEFYAWPVRAGQLATHQLMNY
jgi:hypothetical protein